MTDDNKFNKIKERLGGSIFRSKRSKRGYVMIEILIDIMILSFLAVAIFEAYSLSMKSANFQKSKGTAAAIANQRMEEIRAMHYDEIGLKNAVPAGSLDEALSADIPNEGKYILTTSVRYVDDPADGIAVPVNIDEPVDPANPNTYKPGEGDTRPYDYKKVSITVKKEGSSKILAKLVSDFTSKVAETESETGGFMICVRDVFGNIVPNAKIDILLDASEFHTQGELSMTGLEVEVATGCLFQPNLQEIKSTNQENFYELRAYVDDGEQKYSLITRRENIIVQQLSRFTMNVDEWRNLKIYAKNYSDGNSIPNLHLELSYTLEGTEISSTAAKDGDLDGIISFSPSDYLPTAAKYKIDSAWRTSDNKIYYPIYSSLPEKWGKDVPEEQTREMWEQNRFEVTVYFDENSMLPQRINILNDFADKIDEAPMQIYGINLDTTVSVELESATNGMRIGGTFANPKYVADNPPNRYGNLYISFNLTNASAGKYHVIIKNQNGEIKLNNSFEINE